jgi:CcmD family protein
MDPVLQEIYSTVLDAAPYVIAAYVLLWVGLFGYVAFVLIRIGRVEKEVAVLEDSVEQRTRSSEEPTQAAPISATARSS